MDLRQEFYETKKEPEELFNDSWFFGNPLRRRSSHSEPCTPFTEGKSYEETYESIEKLSGRGPDESTRRLPFLVKAPSMPCSTEIVEEEDREGISGLKRSKLLKKKKKMMMMTSSSQLARAPSLPISLRDHEGFEDDEEIEFSMGRLIRLASMNSPDGCLPRRTTQGASTKRGAKAAKLESINSDSMEEDISSQLQQLKCSSAPNSKESLGFRNSGIIDIAADFTGNNRSRNLKEQSSDLPIPTIWGGKKSSTDTKEQIKFWARSVASNVRQEC